MKLGFIGTGKISSSVITGICGSWSIGIVKKYMYLLEIVKLQKD